MPTPSSHHAYQDHHSFGPTDARIARTHGRQFERENERFVEAPPFDEETVGFETPLQDDPEFDAIALEELQFLAQFIHGTGFYAESLEEYLGEILEDFWQAREHAYHIVTTYLIERAGTD